MIAVVDYCKGNLRSVQKGLEAAGARDVRIVADPAEVARAQAVVLPGVGAFADASAFMRESGQMGAVRDAIQAGVPFLGICLGMHLLFEAGVEGAPGGTEAAPGSGRGTKPAPSAGSPLPHSPGTPSTGSAPGGTAPGMGILPGVVRRMPRTDAQGRAYKVPHMGWNAVEIDPAATSPLLSGVPQGEWFYFTHSYIAPECPAVQARVTHSTTFPCFVDVGRTCFGIQFHPEKSSDAGLAVLRNFVAVVENR